MQEDCLVTKELSAMKHWNKHWIQHWDWHMVTIMILENRSYTMWSQVSVSMLDKTSFKYSIMPSITSVINIVSGVNLVIIRQNKNSVWDRYQTQWFSRSYFGIGTGKLGLKWSSRPEFSNLVPLLTAEHSHSALTFWSILYLALQQLLWSGFIILPFHCNKLIKRKRTVHYRCKLIL